MNDVKLIDITPSSIADDAQIKALAEAFDDAVCNHVDLSVLQILTNVEGLHGDILDLIAWQLHVDGYDETDTDEIKRHMILSSIEVHRHKGTPWAVARAVASVFRSAQVAEWFEYGGEPYHFKVNGITEHLTDSVAIERMVNLINAAKNTRSWLDCVEFINEIDSTEYYAGWIEISDTLSVDSDLSEIEKFTFNEYICSYVEDFGTMTIITKLS